MPSVNTYLDDAVGQCIGQGQHGGVDQVVPFSGEVLVRPASCVNRRRVGLYGVIGLAASDALTMCHRFRCTRRKPPEHAKLIPSHSASACWGTLNRCQGISTGESVTLGFVTSPLDQISIRNGGNGPLHVYSLAPPTMPRTRKEGGCGKGRMPASSPSDTIV